MIEPYVCGINPPSTPRDAIVAECSATWVGARYSARYNLLSPHARPVGSQCAVQTTFADLESVLPRCADAASNVV